MEEKRKQGVEPIMPDLDLGQMKVPELQELAQRNGIDLEGATRKPDIIRRILEAGAQAGKDGEPHDPDDGTT